MNIKVLFPRIQFTRSMWTLIAVAILHFFAAFALFYISAIGINANQRYRYLSVNLHYSIPAYLLIITGVLMLLTGLLGILSMMRDSSILFAVTTILYLPILLLLASSGALSHYYRQEMPGKFRTALESSITFYQPGDVESPVLPPGWKRPSTSELKRITEELDYLQIEMQCCGIDGYRDWLESNEYFKQKNRGRNPWTSNENTGYLPDSCCWGREQCQTAPVKEPENKQVPLVHEPLKRELLESLSVSAPKPLLLSSLSLSPPSSITNPTASLESSTMIEASSSALIVATSDLISTESIVATSVVTASSLPSINATASDVTPSSLPSINATASDVTASSLPSINATASDVTPSSLPSINATASDVTPSSLPSINATASNETASSLPSINATASDVKPSLSILTPSPSMSQSPTTTRTTTRTTTPKKPEPTTTTRPSASSVEAFVFRRGCYEPVSTRFLTYLANMCALATTYFFSLGIILLGVSILMCKNFKHNFYLPVKSRA